MSLIPDFFRNTDNNTIRVSTLNNGDIDGDSIRVGSLSIDSIGRISIGASSIDEERQRISDNTEVPPSFPYDRSEYLGVSDSTTRVTRISDSSLRNEVLTTVPINDWSEQGIFSNRRYSIFNEIDRAEVLEDLVFLDMKVENLGDVFKTTITYIDRKNYQEVKKEYFCNCSIENPITLGNNKLNVEITSIGEIKETRKDI